MRNVRRRLIHSVVTISIAGVGAISGIAIGAPPAHASVDTTVAIAVPGNANASQPAISADGRFVAFVSSAVSLGADGNNSEVFVHDRQLNTDELTSVNNNGDPADEFAGFAAISADGRFVAFETAATNFPGSDYTNPNIYVRDRQAGTTTNLTNNHGFATAGGNIVNSRVTISADGSTVAFDAGDLLPSDTNNRVDVYVSRGGSLTVETASGTNGVHVNNSVAPSLSADGTYLVFASDANDFVANDTNGLTDVYRKNLTTGDVVLVSRTRSGAPATGYSGSPDISDDGRYVVYNSFAQNIINQPSPSTLCSHNYRYDVQADTVDFVDITAQGREQGFAGCSFEANISPSGRYVTFASQNGGLTPASYFGGVVQYLKDMQTGKLEAVSVDHVGNSGEIFSDIVFGRGDVTDVGSVVFTSTTNLSGQCCYQGVYERDQGPAATGAASGVITQDIANPRTPDYIGFNIAVDAPDVQILAYSVDYGDGTQSQQYDVLPVNDDHHALTHHQYPTAGTYTVTATMIDDDDRVITTSHDVVVRAPNVAPTAALAAAPSSGVAPTTVLFDATGSTDSDGTIANYDFNFGDGSANVSGAAPSASHQYTTPGTFTATVVITDNDGATNQRQQTITITAPPITSVKGGATFTSYIGGTKKARITVNVVRKVVKHVLTYTGSLTYNDTPAGLKGTCKISGVAAVDRTGFDNGAILTVTCTGTKTGPQANLIGTGTISVFDASAVGATDHVQLNVGGALNWSNSYYMPLSKIAVLPTDTSNNGGGGGGGGGF